MSFDNILCEKADGIAKVTVNRPDKLNALNAATIAELAACFAELEDDDAARVVVLTGAGEKAFVAGADIGELADMTASGAEQLAARGQALMDRIENLGKPVIAAVNGFALGGGCELAMACTFRYAVETARLNFQLNDLDGRATHMIGTLDSVAEDGFDLILANIYGDILLDLVDSLTFKLKPGGSLLLSGILWEYNFDVRQAYKKRGCEVLRNRILDEFSTILLRKE